MLTKSKGYCVALVRALGDYLAAENRSAAVALLAASAAFFAGRHCLPGNGLATLPVGRDTTIGSEISVDYFQVQ